MMEQRLQFLMRRLSLLGYRPKEINDIMKSAGGDPVSQLEHYERLGVHYLQNYSQ